jgi:hypothetical protein
MARRPSEHSEKSGLPGFKHWLIAGLAILAMMTALPFLSRLL